MYSSHDTIWHPQFYIKLSSFAEQLEDSVIVALHKLFHEILEQYYKKGIVTSF